MQYRKPDTTAQNTQWTELVSRAKILLSLYRAKTHCLEYFVMNHWQLKLDSRRPTKYTVGIYIYKLFYENCNFVQLLFYLYASDRQQRMTTYSLLQFKNTCSTHPWQGWLFGPRFHSLIGTWQPGTEHFQSHSGQRSGSECLFAVYFLKN